MSVQNKSSKQNTILTESNVDDLDMKMKPYTCHPKVYVQLMRVFRIRLGTTKERMSQHNDICIKYGFCEVVSKLVYIIVVSTDANLTVPLNWEHYYYFPHDT